MRPIIFAAALCLALHATASAQPAQNATMPVVITPSPAQATLSAQQLRKLVAPIALYPDQVLTDILAAATTPAQVVQAQRFATDPAHKSLTSAARTQAAAGQDWDPSVKALLMFPHLLEMMDANLDWTEHLGRAFAAQQADTMNAIQQLRLAAEKSGALASGPSATVVNEGGDIAIDPPSQQDMYLPTYQPDCVFGPNPACEGPSSEVYWASAILLPYGYPQWGFLDWGHREIRVAHAGGLGTAWRHDNLHLASGSLVSAPPRMPGTHVKAAPVFHAPPHLAGAMHAVPGPGHR